ncbi:tetratricopeptide repeat protein [Flavobacterium soli]|uniref:tetratricopeptide repeat protein n=1 Tax=Flavobacterium soli TaxID=344881 RepID=UPI000416AD04|nr:tetratricopeptide repeat protein [Flavobacterium soli]
MNKKTLHFIIGLTFLFNATHAQDFKKEFDNLFQKQDTLAQQLLLEKWEKVAPNDAELFVSNFNFYANKSRKEVIALGQDPQGDTVFQLMDQDSTKTDPVGFIYGEAYYDQQVVQKAFEWIRKGVKTHPNRLDMRFGEIYLYGELEDYSSFTTAIIETLDYSNKNQNKWIWSNNKPLDDAKDFMLGSIQSYQLQLYNTENNDLLNNMKQIATAVLKYYPDNIESLSNISIVFMIQKEYDKALESLLKAEKLNSNDPIVLSNIAHAYKLKNDTASAIKYYKKTIELGDEQMQEFAKRQIDLLQNK